MSVTNLLHIILLTSLIVMPTPPSYWWLDRLTAYHGLQWQAAEADIPREQ
jgi:hypothetical protein